jgi:Na+-translocating ferredoxin:NAD+ oxidoreductase RnfC subunit
LAAQRRERDQADQARGRFEARQARKQRELREKAEADKRKKELLRRATSTDKDAGADTGEIGGLAAPPEGPGPSRSARPAQHDETRES